MACPPAGSGESARFPDLGIRLIPALGVAALTVVVVWLGGIWLTLFAAVAALVMILEWRWITARQAGNHRMQGAPYAIAAAGSICLLAVAPFWASVLFLLAGVAAGMALDRMRGRWPAGFWSAPGALYIGGAGIALVMLRADAPFGIPTVVWAVLIVVATDIGGYFVGRTLRGPKLWRRVSPNKTWAGTLGGITLACLVGVIFGWAITGSIHMEIGLISIIAAMISQAGDLGESALKRHFGVKDAGRLIPGHGGLLDRLDGHIPVILAATILTFLRGQAVFVW